MPGPALLQRHQLAVLALNTRPARTERSAINIAFGISTARRRLSQRRDFWILRLSRYQLLLIVWSSASSMLVKPVAPSDES